MFDHDFLLFRTLRKILEITDGHIYYIAYLSRTFRFWEIYLTIPEFYLNKWSQVSLHRIVGGIPHNTLSRFHIRLISCKRYDKKNRNFTELKFMKSQKNLMTTISQIRCIIFVGVYLFPLIHSIGCCGFSKNQNNTLSQKMSKISY